MRIAVLLRDKCQPKQCNMECIKSCPPVRTGHETIVIGEDGKPVISEELCVGCGICVHRCPFDAIKIIGLPEALEKDLIHQYSRNGFRLFRLPIPVEGQVIGLLGKNGIGKTTVLNIMSGGLVPNLGDYPGKEEIEEGEDEGEDAKKGSPWDPVIKYYSGRELQDYFQRLASGKLKTALKPQYVDAIPKMYSGNVFGLLSRVTDDTERIKSVCEDLGIMHILDRDIGHVSGGELQMVSIAATLLKEADVYFFDEPSSYLDVHQRLKIARLLRRFAEGRYVMVVEHDLAILDFLADNIHLMYGEEGAYGIVTHPKSARVAINIYLEGYLREENIRFRDYPIEFETHPPKTQWETEVLYEYPALSKALGNFKMEVAEGGVHEGEVVGILGPNATGKTTFVKMLAGVIEADNTTLERTLRVSYKPQYIKPTFEGTVLELYTQTLNSDSRDGDGVSEGDSGEGGNAADILSSPFYKAEIERPLGIDDIYNTPVTALSGGELQRVAIGLCLAREADIYLLDEPSAYLDSNQRMVAAKTIKRVMEKGGTCAMVVDHDIYFIDLICDSLIVFSGEGGRYGMGRGPYDMRAGMNMFLKRVDITFRRDAETKRPRINKEGSHLDREQKSKGEYYYLGTEA